MRRLRVVVDADVLVDAQVRDIFLALAEAGLIELRWNGALVDELRTILIDDMGRQADAADRLCAAFRNAYPLGEVLGAESMAGPLAPMPVGEGSPALAVALSCEADIVVAHDRNRYPDDEVLVDRDLEVLAPGEALAAMVEILGAGPVAREFEQLTTVLDVPPAELLRRLRRFEQVAPIAAIAIGAHLDAPGYPSVLREYLLGSRPADARAAVSDLVNCVGDGDLAGMEALLSPAARAALGPSERARHRALRVQFSDVLYAPGDWGFDTADRVVGPEAEIITLVRNPESIPGASEEPGEQAIVFGVVFEDGRWCIDDIELRDEPARRPR
jgi:hypothetical protein